MFEILFVLFLLTGMLWLGFKLTGAVLMAGVWLFVEVPLSLLALAIGLACCCTVILIPVGMWFFKVGLRLLIPGI